MSVLACDRKGCSNIMCDRYSRRFKYICPSCFEELTEFLKCSGVENYKARLDIIEAFMESPKHDRKDTISAVAEFLNEEFPTEVVRHAR